MLIQLPLVKYTIDRRKSVMFVSILRFYSFAFTLCAVSAFLAPRVAFAQPPVNEWMFDARLLLSFNELSVEQTSEFSLQTAPGLWWNDDGEVVAVGHNGSLSTRNGYVMGRHRSSAGRQTNCLVGDPSAYERSYFFSSSGIGLESSRFSFLDSSLVDSATIVQQNATGAIAATRHCDGRDYWVIAGGASNTMYIQHVTRKEVLPFSVSMSVQAPRATDVMAIGNSGKVVAWTIDQNRLAIGTFDNTLGQIQSTVEVRPDATLYGVAWSPNGRLLYVSAIKDGRAELWQLSTINPDPTAILSSKVVLYSYSGPRTPGMLQVGPDLRLYWVYAGTGYIGTISNPDIPGIGCDVTPQDIAVPIALHGTLPNIISAFHRFFPGCTVPPIAEFELSDTTICVNSCIDLIDHSDYLATSWEWSMPGSDVASSSLQHPKNICYAEAGEYPVTLVARNSRGEHSKTLVVTVKELTVPEMLSAEYCEGDTIVFALPEVEFLDVQPRDGSVSVSKSQLLLFGNQSRDYTLTVADSLGCIGDVLLSVSVVPPPLVEIQPLSSLSVCKGGSVVLKVESTELVTWHPVDVFESTTGSVATAVPDSSQWLYVQHENTTGCASIDSVYVRVSNTFELDKQDTVEGCVGTETLVSIGLVDSLSVDGIPAQTDSLGQLVVRIENSTTLTVNAWQAGCKGTTTVSIRAVNAPTLQFALPDAYCADDTILVQASTMSASIRYLPGIWNSESTTVSVVASTNPQVLRFEASNGLCTTLDSVVVQGVAITRLEIEAPSHSCVGDSIVVQEATGQEVQWYQNNVLIASGTSATIATQTAGLFQIEARSTNAACVMSTSVTYEVHSYPTFEYWVEDALGRQVDTMCRGEMFYVRVSNLAPSECVISYSGNVVEGTFATFEAEESGSIVVTATNINSCATTRVLTLHVKERWTVEGSFALDAAVAYGETVQLSYSSSIVGDLGETTSAIVSVSVPFSAAEMSQIADHPAVSATETSGIIWLDAVALHRTTSTVTVTLCTLRPLLNAEGTLNLDVSVPPTTMECGIVSVESTTFEIEGICFEEMRRVEVIQPVTVFVHQLDSYMDVRFSRTVDFCEIELTNVLGQRLERQYHIQRNRVQLSTVNVRGPVMLTVRTEAGQVTKFVLLD